MLESMLCGWNFPFHAGNELSDECGDRAVGGIDQLEGGEDLCISRCLSVCLATREKRGEDRTQ